MFLKQHSKKPLILGNNYSSAAYNKAAEQNELLHDVRIFLGKMRLPNGD